MSILLRRGLDSERAALVLQEGELIYTTDTKKLWVGDGVTVGGSDKVAGDDFISISVVNFSSTDARFFGELGTPMQQGWTDDGNLPPDLVQETVFGTQKTVVRFNDDSSSRVSALFPLTGDDWQNINTYGAVFSGTARLDSTDGSLGFFTGLQANSGQNPDPVNTGNRRYAVSFNWDGEFVEISSPDVSGSYTFDENSPVTVLKDEWFTYEIIVPPGMGDAEVYINNVLVPYAAVWNVNAGGTGTQVIIGSGSTTGTNRISYHDNFGVTIYEDSNSRMLTNDELSLDDVFILVPAGRRDYTVLFPTDGIGRKVGDRLSFDLQNVNGRITFTNEDPNEPKALVNGLATISSSILRPTNLNTINTVDGANTYVFHLVDYRDDIVNDKDFGITGEILGGSLNIADIQYPVVDGVENEVMVTDGQGNLTFVRQDGATKILDFDNTRIGLIGSLGLPQEQDWVDASTGNANILINDVVVFGVLRDTIQFQDDSTNGVAAAYYDITAEEWAEIYQNGAVLSFIYENGNNVTSDGLVYVFRVSSTDNPDGSVITKEYTFTIGITGNDLRVTVDGVDAIFDGTTLPQLDDVGFNEYQMVIPPNFGDASMTVGGVNIGIPVTMTTSPVDESKILLTTESDASNTRWSRLAELELVVNAVDTTVTLTEDELLYDDLLIVSPEGSIEFKVIFPNQFRNVNSGSEVKLLLNNVGGTVVVESDNVDDPTILFNDLPSVTSVVYDITNVVMTNRVSLGIGYYSYRLPILESLGNVNIIDSGEGDVLAFDGTAWVNQAGKYVTEFENVDARFFGELGLPSGQGWDVSEGNDEVFVDLIEDTVFGQTKDVVRVLDDGTGLLTIYNEFDALTFQNIFDYGATYSGVGRLDGIDGGNGFFAQLGVNNSDSPLGDATNRRYGISFSQGGGFVEIFFTDSIDGNTATMLLDGISEAVTVVADEWFTYEVVISPGLGLADVYVNGVLLSIQCPFGGTGGGDTRTGAMISSGSSSGGNRVSYHDNYGVTVYASDSTLTLDNGILDAPELTVIIPSGRRDYAILMPENPVPNELGKLFKIIARNTNGIIVLGNENLLNPGVIFDGFNEVNFAVTSDRLITYMNVLGGGNVYISGDQNNEVSEPTAIENPTARPSSPNIGDQVFDVNLAPPVPIWWDGTQWLDSSGTAV